MTTLSFAIEYADSIVAPHLRDHSAAYHHVANRSDECGVSGSSHLQILSSLLGMSAKEVVTNKASDPREESGMSGTSSAVSASNVLSANTEREISKLSAETTDSHKNISRELEEKQPTCVVTVLGLALQPGGVASNQV